MNLTVFEKITCPESLSPPPLAEIPKQVGGGLPGIWVPAGLGQKQAQRPNSFAVCEQKTMLWGLCTRKCHVKPRSALRAGCQIKRMALESSFGGQLLKSAWGLS